MIAHINPYDFSKEQTVPEHLISTARIAEDMGHPLKMRKLALLSGLYHDLGKFRLAFERYIRSNSSQKVGKINHSSAGAVFIYQRYYKGNGTQKLTAQLICETIISHHGINDCMSAEGENCFRKRVENLEGLDYEEVINNLLDSEISLEETDCYFYTAVKEVDEMLKITTTNKIKRSFAIGLMGRMLLSILIDADRLDTAVFCGDREPQDLANKALPDWTLPRKNLEKRLNAFPIKEGIYELRRRIADECLAFSGNPPGIYRLTVPTGGAKTLSSMRYAINHAGKYGKKHIFYIGPYLSILEQNSRVFKEALGMDHLILEHHSNVIFDNCEEEMDLDIYRHLTENWDSPIIITTFVQFLNTLFSSKTSSVRRFHNLSDSVILIDEIQSLPIKMTYIFNMTMNYLSSMCGTTILLSSATQPVLDSLPVPIHMSEPAEIIRNVDSLYRQLNRVRVFPEEEVFDTEKLCFYLDNLINLHKDILVILNTKKAVETVFSGLKEKISGFNETITLIHLSTNMCPQHRLNCLDQIKNRKNGERLICISTSLIEAGVDLSFSCVVRSYTGLDHIAQAAGRCNRNGEEGEGAVYIIHYDAEYLGQMKQIRIGAACSEAVIWEFDKSHEQFHGNLLSRPAMDSFYKKYYHDSDQRRLMSYPIYKLDTNLVDLLSSNKTGKNAYRGRKGTLKDPDLAMYQAFKAAGDNFEVISQNTIGVLVPFEKGKEIISKLNGNLNSKEIMGWVRKGQRYMVDLSQKQIKELSKAGVLAKLQNGKILALKEGFYDNEIGVISEGKEEFLII